MNFKLLLEKMSKTLSVTDIYSFYYVFYIWQTSKSSVDKFHQEEIDTFIRELKKTYIDIFSEIVVDQLKKYIGRGRIDFSKEDKPLFDIDVLEKTKNLKDLDSAMRTTYRGDMKRRNTNWEFLTNYLIELDRASTTKDIFFFLDRINNTVHNTYETMLTKLSNGYELKTALDTCARSPHPDNFKNKIYSKFKELELI